VGERSAKSGVKVSGCRWWSRFPPKPTYYFLAYSHVPWNFHANSFRDICVKSTN